MRRIPLGACLLTSLLALLAAHRPVCAQAPDAQALIERAREIQGEIKAQAPRPQGTSDAGAQDAGGSSTARPQIGEEEIRAMVSRSLDVEILNVEVVDHAGQPAYAITVMNPPGNRNDAFRVATLLFDGATGSLLGQESPAPRTAAAGLETAATPNVEDGGREIRRRSNR